MVKEFKPDQMALSTTVNGKTIINLVKVLCIMPIKITTMDNGKKTKPMVKELISKELEPNM